MALVIYQSFTPIVSANLLKDLRNQINSYWGRPTINVVIFSSSAINRDLHHGNIRGSGLYKFKYDILQHIDNETIRVPNPLWTPTSHSALFRPQTVTWENTLFFGCCAAELGPYMDKVRHYVLFHIDPGKMPLLNRAEMVIHVDAQDGNHPIMTTRRTWWLQFLKSRFETPTLAKLTHEGTFVSSPDVSGATPGAIPHVWMGLVEMPLVRNIDPLQLEFRKTMAQLSADTNDPPKVPVYVGRGVHLITAWLGMICQESSIYRLLFSNVVPPDRKLCSLYPRDRLNYSETLYYYGHLTQASVHGFGPYKTIFSIGQVGIDARGRVYNRRSIF